MVEIHPNALYTRGDLAGLLEPMGVDVDGWIAKVRPVRRFRLLFWGADLIRAIDKTPPLPERQGEHPALPAAANRGGRRRRGEADDDPAAPLKRLMREDHNANAR